jgi:hypothetical protein
MTLTFRSGFRASPRSSAVDVPFLILTEASRKPERPPGEP